MIRTEAGPFCSSSFSAGLWWEFKEPKSKVVAFSRPWVRCVRHLADSDSHALQGYLAHKKTSLPSRSTMGPKAQAYCKVLGRGVFL